MAYVSTDFIPPVYSRALCDDANGQKELENYGSFKKS